ncbi:terminase small subunit [Comamonas sp. NLF-1-9]|uniref:terminase small subunit n=1 Tax=Comamonas sp. NLF-1-9 TaxID=2853163 RepID=UPI001C47E763|nr:terminase small subunit [Comamonas sp. NLF-1-9]QXL83265.1 terminase small subunit [Comamonas sp. NLF-1-9]
MSITQAELGQLIGVTQGRVSQLISEGVIAGTTVADQVSSYTAHLRAVAAGRADTPEVTSERARLLAAQASREELRLAEDQGELIRLQVVRAGLASLLASTRDRLMQLPARLAQELAAESDADAVRRALDDEIHAALYDLARAPVVIGGDHAVAD